jgi:hypothetical protein
LSRDRIYARQLAADDPIGLAFQLVEPSDGQCRVHGCADHAGVSRSQLPARSTVMPRLILDGVLRLEDRSYDELLGMLVR